MSEPTLQDCINYMRSQIKQMEKHPRSYEFNLPYYRKTVELLEKEERPHGEWIPIKLRPMTEEEVKEQEEKWGWTLDDYEKFVFDCPLPDEGQEILIQKIWGVSIDTCEYDPDYGYGLEENGDWIGVLAWMPLPKPYKEEGEAREE